jgi:cystathionine beta-lyase/cystathionine gamma-synthase
MFDLWEDEKPKHKKKAKTKKKKQLHKKIQKHTNKIKTPYHAKKKQSILHSTKKIAKDVFEPEKKAYHWAMNSKPTRITKEKIKKEYAELKNNPNIQMVAKESKFAAIRAKTRLFTHKPKFCPECGSDKTVHQFPNGEYGCYKCNAVWGKKK